MATPFNEDLEKLLQIADNTCLSKGQIKITTPLLFDATLRLFTVDNKYSEAYSQIKEIFGRYGLNSALFNEALESLYPSSDSLPAETETILDDDARNLIDVLQLKAQNERVQQTVFDLLAQLFLQKTYKLYFVFSKASDILKERYDAAIAANVSEDELPQATFDVNLFYADMQSLLIKKSVKSIPSLEAESMTKYLTNINKYVDSRSDFKLIGMENELKALEVALCGRTKKCAVLVGKAGVGKTSLIYEFARRINNNDVPEPLKGTVVYELHMDALVAGSMFRGQFEERLLNILNTVSKLKNVILFIDEFHTMVKAGSGGSDSGGDQNGSNIMKPYLSRGDIWVIGATTDDEYNEYVEKDKAISRRFKKVHLDEPNKEETIEIMRGILPLNEKFFDREMEDVLLEKVYTLSTQYNIHSANPDRALTMLESAFAYAKVCREQNKDVVIDDMVHALELQYNVKISDKRAQATEKEAKSFLLGQDEPITEICKYLNAIEMNIVNPKKPKCVLMFTGSTGTGKTEMAKIIAKNFTGSENNLITVQCSTLQAQGSESSIFGASPGYVGYKQTSDFLAQVKQKPNSVVLFDEIEKAHPNIFKSLLGMMDEGYVQDTGGNKISFRNAIIIFTTNIGYGTSNHTGTGLMRTVKSADTSMTEINKHFSPEFIGRMTKVIAFNRLSNDIAGDLIERYRKNFEKESGINVKFTKADIDDIISKADIASLGARNLENTTLIAFTEKAMAANEKAGKKSK